MPHLRYVVELKLDRLLVTVLLHPSTWRLEPPPPVAQLAVRDYLRHVMHQHAAATTHLARGLEGEIERGLAAEQPTLEGAWPLILAYFARTGVLLPPSGTPAPALLRKMTAALEEAPR